MRIFRKIKKEYEVKPNTVGYLYRDNKFERILTAGRYEISDPSNRTEVFILPEVSQLLRVPGQEVLTRDNIALRFSYCVSYKITDGQKFLSRFTLDKNIYAIIHDAEWHIANRIVKPYILDRISTFDSETINEKRKELTNFKNEEMEKEVAEYGITLENAQLIDLTFPKPIQVLFARHLEAKIRAKADLENARTAVATARALKNASELMKDDDNLKFFQIIETVTKIAEKGNHTFMIGDMQQLVKK